MKACNKTTLWVLVLVYSCVVAFMLSYLQDIEQRVENLEQRIDFIDKCLIAEEYE